MELKPKLLIREEGNKFHRLWGEKDEKGFAGIESAELFDSSEEAKKAFNEKYPDLNKI